MKLPKVGSADLGLESPEKSELWVLALMTPNHPWPLGLVVAPGGEPRMPGTQNTIPFQ